jgi:RNA polymerase sporulation-specific sigma factor
LEAIKAYDYETKVKFRNFAYICIKRELDSAISRSNRKKRQILNNAIPIYAYVEEENSRYGSEYYTGENLMRSTKDTPEEALIAREEVQELIGFLQKQLTNLELKVLFLRIEGLSYREITNTLEIQTKAVDNAIQRIRKKVMLAYMNNIKSA